jgi:rhamnogalacturonan acetylesterase
MKQIAILGDSTSGRELVQAGYRTLGWANFANDHLNAEEYVAYDRCSIGWGIRDFFNRRPDWIEHCFRGLEPGDIAVACFGTLERSPMTRPNFGARGSLFGKDDRFEIVYDEYYKVEYKVYTFGEYLRRMVKRARDKGLDIYFLSQVPRNTWKNGEHVRTYSIMYAQIMSEVAAEVGCGFIDINQILSEYLQGIGEEAAKDLYSPQDKSHTTEAGAKVYADIIIRELLKEIKD